MGSERQLCEHAVAEVAIIFSWSTSVERPYSASVPPSQLHKQVSAHRYLGLTKGTGKERPEVRDTSGGKPGLGSCG